MPSVATAPLVRGPSVPSAVGLVLANLVPLVGVIWFGWDLFGIMWLYWAENGVIGAFALLRMLTAGEPIRWWTALARVVPGGFFVVHFGMFWFVHGVFVYSLFGGGRELEGAGLAAAFEGVPWEGLVPLVLSHGASFAMNYLAGGEWRATNTMAEMFKPYGRVVVLHIVIIAGGFLLLAADGAIWAMALFVLLKTGLDLGIHLKGHEMRRQEARQSEEEAPEEGG
ncbi:MAG TPA: hypothetical protein EYQ24_00490 [Bacteroidetes bacterium]|nr:hypothetical protein [Bacteroidota bacterium]HIL57869.1 hypothetical protein [Rhodothermales bacterium]